MALSNGVVNAELLKLRNDIDQIDQQLHNILLRRLTLVEEIALVKSSLSLNTTAAYAPKREAEILNKHQHLTKTSQNANFIKDIYRAIFSATRRIQKKLTIGAYTKQNEQSLMAAIYYFGDYHDYQTNHNLKQMTAQLQNKKYDWLVIESEAFTTDNQQPEHSTTAISAEFTLNCINKTFFVLSAPQRKN